MGVEELEFVESHCVISMLFLALELCEHDEGDGMTCTFPSQSGPQAFELVPATFAKKNQLGEMLYSMRYIQHYEVT